MEWKIIQLDNYFDEALTKFAHDGYSLEKKVQISTYFVNLFATSPVYDQNIKSAFHGFDRFMGVGPYWLTFVFTSLSQPTIQIIDDYSKAIYNYAFNKVTNSHFFHRIVIPVMLSNDISSELQSFVLSYDGNKLRYPTVDIIRPVLIDLKLETLYYNSKMRWRYSRTTKIAKEAIEKYIVVDSMKKT